MGAIVVVSVLPLGTGGTIRLPFGTDKWMHAFFYGTLAALAAEAWAAVGAGPRVAAARGLAQAVAYGAAVEWLQSFTAREPSLGDWVADLAGAGIGAAAWIVARAQEER